MPPFGKVRNSSLNKTLKVKLALYDWVLLNSSGGKDSQTTIRVMVQMAQDQGYPLEQLVVVHCDLGNRVEWDGTRELAEEQARHYGLRFEVVSRPQGDILDEVRQRHAAIKTKAATTGEPEASPWPSNDATERAILRPIRGQKRFYSGKKKRHTLKHQIVVVRKRKEPGRGGQRRRVRIAAVSKAFPGKTHDKKVYDRAAVVCPAGARRTGDTAYLGTGLCTSRRRPRKGQLTPRQKAGNRRVSRRRIVVEHGIGKMNVWRIAAERYRNPRRRHTLIIKNIAGPHNLMYA